ncbi:MAG: hypothetical protein M0Z75_05905 [Nitrospiraceae bacterium]|nr:hypothetical protein [Nitrospiraceae bacterium]
MTASVIGNKKLVTAANSLLAGLLAITCIFLIRDFISFHLAGNALHATGTAVRAPSAGQPIPGLMDYAAVTKDNIFGFPPMDLKPLTASSAQAPPASVNLIGTVSGTEGYAVVLRDSKEELYKAGQMIPGVGYLKTIRKDSVDIAAAQGGGDLKLQLKDIAHIENASAGPSTGRMSQPPQNRFVSSAGQDSYVLNKSAVADAIRNPTKILADARMLPNMVNGKQQGFVMREIKPGGLFSDLGLQNGDVLLKVNNNELNGPDVALRAFSALRGLDRVDLDVIRGGQKLTLTYQIK